MRVHRKRTLGEKIVRALEMPHLRRRERNQRIAIGAVLITFLLYVIVFRPIINWLMPPDQPTSSKVAPPKAPGLNPTKR